MGEDKKTMMAIVSESIRLSQELIENEGELSPELEKFLEVNAKELTEKTDNYAFMLKQLKAQSQVLKDRAEEFYSVAKRLTNAHDSLRDRLKYAMETLEVTQLSGDNYKFSLKPTQGSLKIDEAKLAKAYQMQVTLWQPDKETIKDLLKKDVKIEGAELVPGTALTVSVSRGK